MRIKKGDYVQVIAGKDIGKKGKVLRVIPKKSKVIVEGVNYIFKHLRKSQQNPQGGRIEKESPIDASNVMLYCTQSQAPTRVTYKIKTEEQSGKEKRVKIRYSKASSRQI